MSARTNRRTTRGQGLVEFALIIPVFLALLFGIIEMSWLLYASHSLTNATREGARFAMVHGEMSGNVATNATVGAVVSARAPGLSGPITTTIAFSPNAEPGSQVNVSTSYQHMPIIGMVIGTGAITLQSQSTVIVQY